MSDRRTRFISGDPADQEALLAALDSRTIRLVLPAAPIPHSLQVLAIAATDLLGRIFPRISFGCDSGAPANDDLPPGPGSLLERLELVRRNGTEPLEPTEPATVAALGTDAEADFYAVGYGWQSYLGTEPSRLAPDDQDRNPVGALCAASRLAAHVFRHQLRDYYGESKTPVSAYWSALDFSYGSDPLADPQVDLPRDVDAVMVGAGSVGGAALYALARVPGLRGRLTVVDPQALEILNPDRAILATAELAAAETPKVDVAVAALAHHAPELLVDPRHQTIAGYVAETDREQTLPLVLCSVDSAASRRSLQDCLPLEVVNAACAPGEVMVSGHRTGAGPCVCCLHMEEVLDGERTRWRLLARATGFNQGMVLQLLVAGTPLEPQHLEAIERHRGLGGGALAEYAGQTLDQLWRAALLYGETQIATGASSAAVAAPWITSLAGFLLASEALKYGDSLLADRRLGPGDGRVCVKWEESLYGSPADGILSSPTRWPSNECLCRSSRRRRLTMARYGLQENEYPA